MAVLDKAHKMTLWRAGCFVCVDDEHFMKDREAEWQAISEVLEASCVCGLPALTGAGDIG
jgi:hypothetical protein